MKTVLAATLALFTLATFSGSATENRVVRINNRSNGVIRYVYASNVDRDRWEEDLLGPGRMIWPDHYVNANIDDGTGHCLYDIKVVLFDQREAIWRNYNVCTGIAITVTE